MMRARRAHELEALAGRGPCPAGFRTSRSQGSFARFPLYTGLKAGDTELLQSIMDPQVLIFESGGVESSWEEYASHHLGADMTFMANMSREIISRKILEQGEFFVIATQARLTGTYRDEQIDSMSDETLVLQKKEQGWRITHIHWSSQ